MTPADLNRRQFLLASVAGTAIAWTSRASALYPTEGDASTISADKGFSRAWLESLTQRGEPLTATSARNELKYIGMPVGGIGCGQVYLSGDGRLWCWDIFNLPQAREWSDCGGLLYAAPTPPVSPFRIECVLEHDGCVHRLDHSGGWNITFTGQYPVGTVRYESPGSPLKVELIAFSPYCPLETEDSSLPCTLLRYRVTNTADHAVSASVAFKVENPVALNSAQPEQIKRVNRSMQTASGASSLLCAAEVIPPAIAASGREDITFEDFEGDSYGQWTVTGTAFGDRPRRLSDIAPYQGNLRAHGQGLVNTHQTRHGEDVRAADAHIGTLTSPEFTISRDHISFLVGGGQHPGQTCINLLVDGAPVRTAAGRNDNAMRLENWDVREFTSRKARIQIVDGWTGAWGQIGVDDIVFTDHPKHENFDSATAPDFGTFAVGVVGSSSDIKIEPIAEPGERPVGTVRASLNLPPGGAADVVFAVAWHFPNVDRNELGFLRDIDKLHRHYAKRFADATAVIDYVHANLAKLTRDTLAWRDTWYDSTLPHWFLDRTFANNSTAATSTCFRFDNGRFYGWEGTHSCAGTCTHVWQYAQGIARTFPELERSVRRDIDFAAEFESSGVIHFRGEADRNLAVDGQCGTIIRAWREHTMSPDDSFLQAVYPNVRKAIELLISRDIDCDGILDGEQYNTLDTPWYGKIAWISSLYIATLRAGAEMARDVGDQEFAAQCDRIADAGRVNMTRELFNGEYFVHIPDPKHPETNSTGAGCHIDQVLGQSFAWQVRLPRVTEESPTNAALKSLFRYNFAPDAGGYRNQIQNHVKGGRWYAMPGESGLVMCTWPKGGSDAATGRGNDAWAAGYFNECMSGFEHQVASHMIAEGLVMEGLAITRAVHDRYHPSRRNPYNEIECSNHYARAMASYGSFVTACGFSHHGPRRELGFAPRIFERASDHSFRAAFIACEGWGSYEQLVRGTGVNYRIAVHHGRLRIQTLELPILRPNCASLRARNELARGAVVKASAFLAPESASGFGTFQVKFASPDFTISAGQTIELFAPDGE